MNVHIQTIQKEQRYLYFIIGTMLLLFASYVYFVSATVVHVVIRQETSQQIAFLHSEISKLEAQYIEAQHSISSDVASLQGFVETGKKIFIDRNPGTLVLSTSFDR